MGEKLRRTVTITRNKNGMAVVSGPGRPRDVVEYYTQHGVQVGKLSGPCRVDENGQSRKMLLWKNGERHGEVEFVYRAE